MNARTMILILLTGCAGHHGKTGSQDPRVASDPYGDELAAMGYLDDDAAAAAAKRRGKCPGAMDGSELIGKMPSEWTFTDWSNSEALNLEKLRGRVVVVRFWTGGCQFCERTMPVLQKLSEEFQGQPVVFVGAFHAKPANSVSDMAMPLTITKKWGVTFPIAFDRDWGTLKAWWVDGVHHRHATSATFVIGKDGRFVHIHPGPVFFPSNSPEDAKANADYTKMREAIRSALAG